MFIKRAPRPRVPTALQGGGALSGVRHTCALLDHLTLKPAVGRAQGFPMGTRIPGWAAPRPGKVSRRPHCLLGGRWRWVCQVGGALGRNRGVPGPAPPTSRPGYPRASDGPVLRRGGFVALAPPLSYRSGAIDLVSPPFSMFGWFPLLPFGGGPLARCAATTLRLWFGFRAVVALRGGS